MGTSLLAHLRAELGRPDLEFGEPPERILGSYDTAIYTFRLANAPDDWSRPLILRVLRGETDPERARFEATVQSVMAGQSYPAPRPLHVCEDKSLLGGAFVVMERLPGRVMLQIFSPMLFRLSNLMAECQAELHALDPAPVLRTLAAAGIDPERYDLDTRINNTAAEIEGAQLGGLRPAMDWLIEHRPAGGPLVICHGDFHPLNILVDKGAVTGVIDWANITLADPAYDVGATTAIFSHGPVDIAAFAAPLVDAIRNWIIRRYRRRYEELQDLDNAAAGYFEALRSLGFLVEAGQRIQAERGIVTPTDKPTAFADPRQLRRIRERIEELTGVPAALPN